MPPPLWLVAPDRFGRSTSDDLAARGGDVAVGREAADPVVRDAADRARRVDVDPAVGRERRMQGDADQSALAGRVDGDGRERRRQQRAVLDDAQRPALLGDEETPVGRLRERGRARQADDPALVAREAARLRRRAADLDQRGRPRRDVARGVGGARAHDVLAARIAAGVERRRIRRARVGGADRDAVDLELDAGDGDVVGRRRGDGDGAGETGREIRRRRQRDRRRRAVERRRRRHDEHRRRSAGRRRAARVGRARGQRVRAGASSASTPARTGSSCPRRGACCRRRTRPWRRRRRRRRRSRSG